MLHEEAGSKIAGQNLPALEIQLFTACCAGGHGSQKRVPVQALRLGIGQGFTHAGERSGDHDLVGHLGVLAAARRTKIGDVGAHGPENGEASVKIRPVTAHQDGQGARLGAAVPAGDRSIQHPQAPGGALPVNALGQGGAGGGHIHEDGALRGAVQDIAGGKIDLLHILGKAHHGDDHLAGPYAVPNGAVEHSPLRRDICHLFRMPGINMDLIARLH